jgi:hypothetical protein
MEIHVLGYSEKQEQIYVSTFISLASQLSYKMETPTYINMENDNVPYFIKIHTSGEKYCIFLS